MRKSFIQMGAISLMGLMGWGLAPSTSAAGTDLGQTNGYLGNNQPGQVVTRTMNGVTNPVSTVEFSWTPEGGDQVAAFCAQPGVPIYTNNAYTFTAWRPQDFFTEEQGDLLENFWAAYHDDVVDSVTVAAFQFGIWAIVFDGELTGEGAAWDLAVQWLSDVPTGLAASQGLELIILEHPDFQNLITYASTLSAVPSPAAAGLGLMGLAGLAMRRRSRIH